MSYVTLIVDDDPIVCRINEKMLESAGAATKPVCCGNGLEALNYLHDHYRPDHRYLIFLDLNMPVMDGWEFLKLSEKLFPAGNVQILVVSSSVLESDRDKAESFRHVVKFLEKPLNMASVRIAVEGLCFPN